MDDSPAGFRRWHCRRFADFEYAPVPWKTSEMNVEAAGWENDPALPPLLQGETKA